MTVSSATSRGAARCFRRGQSKMKAIRELFLAGTALTVSLAAIGTASAADVAPALPALSSPEAVGWSMDSRVGRVRRPGLH